MSEIEKSKGFRPMRSITRLLIGGILLGSEILENQLRGWDSNQNLHDSTLLEENFQTSLEDEPLPETLPVPQVGIQPQGKVTDVRYALIGLIFEGEEKLDDVLVTTKRIVGYANRVIVPAYRPIRKIGSLRPFQKGLDQLTSRGQSTLERWINRGRVEETHSRQLTQRAAISTVDQSIEYMAENEAITDLIQTQSISLAGQILQLIRSISVSSDYFGEGLVRYVLRRRPRYLLPPPSGVVQKQATWTLQDIRREDL